MNNDLILYNHGGSGNHGCEAIVRSLTKITNVRPVLFSYRPDEDFKYGLNDIGVSIHGINNVSGVNLKRIYLYFMRHIMHNSKPDYRCQFKDILREKGKVIASIGGDLYCGNDTERLTYINKLISNKNKSVLLGCSIEPDKLKNPGIVEDMHRYCLIATRESITYNALIQAGVEENVILCADPAFQLDTVNLELPNGFEIGNTVGINASPLIIMREKHKGAVIKCYENLIEYIIKYTEYQIALIPHVVWSGVSDFEVLNNFYNKYKDTGRIVLVGDHNCMELKGYISRCEIFIGARTHSTIAAYSSCVPTIVVGYSVKARGIATDLFGTTENYVVPTQTLENGDELIEAFLWIDNNKIDVKKHLEKIMPTYKQSSYMIEEKLESILGK